MFRLCKIENRPLMLIFYPRLGKTFGDLQPYYTSWYSISDQNHCLFLNTAFLTPAFLLKTRVYDITTGWEEVLEWLSRFPAKKFTTSISLVQQVTWHSYTIVQQTGINKNFASMPSRRHFKLSNSNHKEQISKANWIPLYAISICQSSQLHLRSIGLTTQLLNRKTASSLLSKEIHFICIALCNRTQQFSKYCLTFFSRIGFQNVSKIL